MIKNTLRMDPTRTTALRRRFQAEMLRRVGNLKRDVWNFIFVQDALGLKDRPTGPAALDRLLGNEARLEGRPDEPLTVLAAPLPGEFRFRTDAGKIEAFRDWLREQIDAHMLKPVGGGDPTRPWTAPYIESAYKRGMVNAYAKVREQDALNDAPFFTKSQVLFIKEAFGQPETTRKLELLFTRTYEDLSGITDEMARQLSRVLADGMVSGLGPRQVARDMMDAIDGISDRRALVLARTEIIHAHAEGQLDAMTELGVTEAGVDVEWSTAGDDQVCPQCEEMDGQTFAVEDSHGLIPLHPNCRCSWIPHLFK